VYSVYSVVINDIMPGKLTTHVLDLTSGKPAVAMKIELWRSGDAMKLIRNFKTNADGRTDGPLLDASTLVAGSYELLFCVKDYFTVQGIECTFLDKVPVRFSIVDANAGYHVPLLVTPWSYQTYRGN
jgi:5-hydroxyisourate hydrolase